MSLQHSALRNPRRRNNPRWPRMVTFSIDGLSSRVRTPRWGMIAKHAGGCRPAAAMASEDVRVFHDILAPLRIPVSGILDRCARGPIMRAMERRLSADRPAHERGAEDGAARSAPARAIDR